MITKMNGNKNNALGNAFSGSPAKTDSPLTVNIRTPSLLKAY